MEGAESGEKSENEFPPLQIDPKCIQDTLRVFFQPIKTNDPRLDFYTMYKRDPYDERIQEALRMYLQPIKNDDPQLAIHTVYKRETMEYDTEYMYKYNEDLNTTLIFAGLFSTVSSAFVIDVQSKLQPDPTERSEAYLRAILLSLDRYVVPGEDPAAPPAWAAPTEIITTPDLLYASLLMSLLAAFVAMLASSG